MEPTIRVLEWEKHQHFKGRDPIWLKLYRSLRDNYGWRTMSSDAARFLVDVWTLAANLETPGEIHAPWDEIAFKVRASVENVQQWAQELARHGFINVISSRYQDDSLEESREEEIREDGEETREAISTRYPEAAAAFSSMRFPGGEHAARRTLLTSFLYPDGKGNPDPSVTGLEYDERLRLTAAAIVELRDQGKDWNARALSGFIRTLKRTPPPDSEAATLRRDESYDAEVVRAREIREQAEEHAAAEIRRIQEGGPTRLTITPKPGNAA